MKQKRLKEIGYSPDHLDQIDVRDHEGFGILAMGNFKEKMEQLALNSTEIATCIVGGEILCIAGYFEMWKGVVEVWVIPSKIVSQHTRQFAEYFKKWVSVLSDDDRYHRIQTSCLDDSLHTRWMKWLGLEKEGVMKKFTQDQQDYAMFAKVK